MKNVFRSEEEFKQFFDNEYFDKLNIYYNEHNKKKKNIVLSKVCYGSILAIFFVIITTVIELNRYINGLLWFLDIIVIFIIVVSVLFAIHSNIRESMFEFNDKIIVDIIAFLSENPIDNIEFSPNKRISRNSLNESNLFNLNVVNYSGKNFIKAPYNKNTMVFSDMYTYVYDIVEKNGKRRIKKRFLFDGIYIGATMNKKSKNKIYLIPNNIGDKFIQSKIKSYIHYSGYDINLENAEFTKKYKVFCDDEIQARYILTMSLMERINKVDEIFKQKKYIVFKEGRRFTMCIDGVSIEKIKKFSLPVFQNKEKERATLLKVFNELNNLFSIYHILDLGNDLYTKYNTEDFIRNTKQYVANERKAEAERLATISFKQ